MSWHPTLDDIERRTDGPQDQPRRGGSKTPNLPLLGSANCWCGDAPNHAWPGRDTGAPHPREAVPA